MDNNYNSVLKEKEKFEDVIDDRPFLRRHIFAINFLIVVLIVFISFVIYFFTILTPTSILKNDFIKIYNDFNSITSNIKIDYDLRNRFHIYGDGSIKLTTDYDNKTLVNYLNNYKVNYSSISNDNYYLLNLDYGNSKFIYEINNMEQFIDTLGYDLKLDNLNSNVSINTYYKILSIVKNSLLEELDNLELKKEVYPLNGKIVVDVNIILSGKDINRIYTNIINKLLSDSECKDFINLLNSEILNRDRIVNDGSSYSLQVRNDMFSNSIYDFKLVIRDGSYRGVISYKDNEIVYDNGDIKYSYKLNIDNNNFEIKTSIDDKLYAVFSGSGNDSGYTYNYQVIDKVDKMSLQIKKGESYNYIFSYVKEDRDKNCNLLINFNISSDAEYNVVEINHEKSTDYKSLEDIDKEKIRLVNYQIYEYLKELYEYLK